jgi:predicted nucleic acid-binding protein
MFLIDASTWIIIFKKLLFFTLSVWEQAYELGFSLRRKGLTIPTVDLIIAALAIENKSLLLHHDEHYEMIVAQYPILQTKYFGSRH